MYICNDEIITALTTMLSRHQQRNIMALTTTKYHGTNYDGITALTTMLFDTNNDEITISLIRTCGAKIKKIYS